MQIFVTKEKVLSLRKFSAVAMGGKGGFAPHFGFLKKLFWNIMKRQKNQQSCKKNNNFNPTNKTKVTYITSILKFLNIGSLVVQVSNTRFNIPSLHL